MALSDNEIIKALEYCSKQGITSECEKCKVTKGCRSALIENALDLINRQKADKEKLEYILMGVMHSVDKWLEGEELNHDETNRAIIMREKTLQIVEKQQAEIRKYKNCYEQVKWERDLFEEQCKTAKAEAIKEFAEDLKKELELTTGVAVLRISVLNIIDDLVKEKTGTDFTQMFMGVDKLKPLPSIDIKEMVGDTE